MANRMDLKGKASSVMLGQKAPSMAYDHQALSLAGAADGLDVGTIQSYIEEMGGNDRCPEILRTFLDTKLDRLVSRGKLHKCGELYIVSDAGPSNNGNCNEDTETITDRAVYAAYKVAVVEKLEEIKEADKLQELLEVSQAMLNLAERLHAMCKRDGFVRLRDIEEDGGSRGSPSMHGQKYRMKL